MNRITLVIIWITIGILSRLLPHLPNATAITSLCLLAGTQFSRVNALLIMLTTMLLSDWCVAHLAHTAVWGEWTLFTYSGFAIITLVSTRLRRANNISLFIYAAVASLAFWIWTNFGVWLTSDFYPRTFSGFFTCFTLALPFLRNALCGDLIWMSVLIAVMQSTVHLVPSPFKGEG